MNKYSVGDKVKIVFPFSTKQDGKIYKVYKKDGQLGIDYNTPGSAGFINNGSFAPLSAFVDGIIKKVVGNTKIDFIENLNFDENTTDFLYSMLNRAKKPDKLAYQFLGRLKTDLNYYLGYGNRSNNCLWFYYPEKHLYYMWFLWSCFPADSKPEWLTFGDLMYYEKEILEE